MKKELSSFFKFYHYIFTRDENKYEYAYDNQIYIQMTPMILLIFNFVVSTIITLTTLNPAWYLMLFINVPIIVTNTIIAERMSDKYIKIRRAERFEREKKREEERKNRFKEKYYKQAREEYERRKEEERRRKEREAERQWREYAKWYQEEFRKEKDERQRQYQQQREYNQRQYNRYDRQHYQYDNRNQQNQYQQNTYGGSSELINSLRILGLDNTATKKEVKSAYRKLSRKHHPDMGGDQESFIKINKAYNYVMDNI